MRKVNLIRAKYNTNYPEQHKKSFEEATKNLEQVDKLNLMKIFTELFITYKEVIPNYSNMESLLNKSEYENFQANEILRMRDRVSKSKMFNEYKNDLFLNTIMSDHKWFLFWDPSVFEFIVKIIYSNKLRWYTNKLLAIEDVRPDSLLTEEDIENHYDDFYFELVFGCLDKEVLLDLTVSSILKGAAGIGEIKKFDINNIDHFIFNGREFRIQISKKEFAVVIIESGIFEDDYPSWKEIQKVINVYFKDKDYSNFFELKTELNKYNKYNSKKSFLPKTNSETIKKAKSEFENIMFNHFKYNG